MKIIKLPKFKPVTCGVCGCVYQVEEGEKVHYNAFWTSDELKGGQITAPCPVCDHSNNLETQKQKVRPK